VDGFKLVFVGVVCFEMLSHFFLEEDWKLFDDSWNDTKVCKETFTDFIQILQ